MAILVFVNESRVLSKFSREVPLSSKNFSAHFHDWKRRESKSSAFPSGGRISLGIEMEVMSISNTVWLIS
jgi:hypothetical protein